MGTAEHSIRFIGRSDILQQVIERLLRPDDLRNNPDQFIRPGFYGLAGTGKSRLLQEIAARAGSITPYVLKLDFETRSGQTLPGTPLNLLRYLIDHLEELDRLSRPVWSRLFWRWSNPFNQCKRLLADWVPPSVSQVIQITSSSASQIAQNISLGTTIPDSLENAFQSALCKLHSRVQTRVVFGDFGQARKFPLILILLDTVDVAPKSIREWLPEMPRLASGKNRLAFHLLVVGAGRARVDGIAETALPPLPEADARLFVREYLSYKLARAAEIGAGGLFKLSAGPRRRRTGPRF